MKRYQIVNRPSDGLELRQLDETAKHINELWARLTEFGEEFKKSTDTLTQAAGSLAGRVTVLETPTATEEPTDPEPTPPPIPTIVAAAAGGFINATVSTLEPVDSYDCQLQEEAVEDPPTEWQNAKYGTFSFIPPLPNTNYVVWARSRRAYLQSDWATSDVVNSGFLPYLLLDASNDPLTGTLEISLPPQPGQSYLESPALSIRYIHDMTAYDLFKIWDNSGGLGEGPWLSLGIWSGETGWPPSMPVFGYFNVDYGPKDGGVSATLETTDSSGNQTGRISFYDSGKAFVNKDGDSLFQHGVFENSINVTGTGDYSCAVYIAEYSGNAAIEYYYYTTSWLKYAYQNVSGFFIDWTVYDEPGFWIGDTEWRDGLWLQTDGFSLSNYSGSEFGSSNENAWINSGSLTLYSFSADTPPFVLSGNNTGVLVTGLNADLLDGYHASAFALDGHNHDHGALAGLADDDHPQYMLRSDLGSGTNNYIPKFLVGATPTFADSVMYESSDVITIDKEPTTLFVSNTTGTNYVYDHKYEAISFTPTSDGNVQSISIRVKWASGNTGGFYGAYIYSDNAGQPGTNLYSISFDAYFERTSGLTSYTEVYFKCAGLSVTSGTKYWFVIYKADTAAILHIDSNSSGTNDHYHSPDLVTWTVNATARCYIKVYGSNSAGLYIASKTRVPLSIAAYDDHALEISGAPGYYAINITTQLSLGINISGAARALEVASTGNNYTAKFSNSGGGYGIYTSGAYAIAAVGTVTSVLIDPPVTASSGINIRTLGSLSATSVLREIYIQRSSTVGAYSFSYPMINVLDSTTQKTIALVGLTKNADATNSIQSFINIRHDTTGTPVAGFGASIDFDLESSTTADQDAAKIEVSWTDATHATRKANMILSVYDTAIRTGLTIAATGSGATLTAGGTLTVGADDAGHDVTFFGATSGKKLLWDASADTLQLDGTLDLNGGATLGSADTDAITCTGRLIVRTVNDGDMDATDGTTAEVVFNSADSKFYGCTVSGSPATWAALN